MRTSICLLPVLWLLLARPVNAGTYVVRPDGTGDYPTIQEAITAAVGGDTILLMDGTFSGPGNRDINYLGKAIAVRSQSDNPAACVIDCEHAGRGFEFRSDEDPNSIIQGVTITNGEAHYPINDVGGGVLCLSGSPTITNCSFLNNTATNSGGGIYAWNGPQAPTLTLASCTFRGNVANDLYIEGGRASATDCAFSANVRSFHFLELTRCRFSDRASLIIGGGTLSQCWFAGGGISEGSGYANPTLSVDKCTFVGTGHEPELWAVRFHGPLSVSNSTISNYVIGVLFIDYPDPPLVCCAQLSVANTIIAFGGYSLVYFPTTDALLQVRCCDFFGNLAGDWVGVIANQNGINGNFSADPLFCDRGNGDLRLAGNSLCLPGAHGGVACGLVGALGEGCPGPQPRFDVAWGTSWDQVSLQQVLDAEYGQGVIHAATDYEGYGQSDADPPYWEDQGIAGVILREIGSFATSSTFGWYKETAAFPVIDGVDDGMIFDGWMGPGATVIATFPSGTQRFGFYLNPNGSDNAPNAPEPEVFFTNRLFNDVGPDGSGPLHDPPGGDPQCLVYNITALRGGVKTYVLAWEECDSGGPITPGFSPTGTDNDFNDMVIEMSAMSPVPGVSAVLQALGQADGILLSWEVRHAERLESLTLLRGEGQGPVRTVMTWGRGTAAATGSWIDHEATSARPYRYQLLVGIGGGAVVSNEAEAGPAVQRPAQTRLLAAVPNPFNPSTRIHFALAKQTTASVEIYDVAGRRVRSLDLGVRPAAEGDVEWDGRDDRGRGVASGSYLVRLVAGGVKDERKVTLIR
jgi:predicted outer membrane repeat protein